MKLINYSFRYVLLKVLHQLLKTTVTFITEKRLDKIKPLNFTDEHFY